MKKLFLVLSCLAVSFSAFSQKVKFDAGLTFDYIFDNTEYYRSWELFDVSSTLHGVRLTPEIGVKMESGNAVHRLRFGIDAVKKAGEGLNPGDAFKEILMYYDFRLKTKSGADFEAVAGSYPTAMFDGDWRGSIFDTRALWTNPNSDGMLFKYRNAKFYANLGLDWCGMYGDSEHPARREEFFVLSCGRWDFLKSLSLRWTAAFHHFACSPMVDGVVDSHTLNPMLEWHPDSGLDTLSFSAGAIITYQRDRIAEQHHSLPSGLFLQQQAGKWGLSIRNSFYWGDDLQPYRAKYGSELYNGLMMFSTLSDKPAWADEIAIIYEPTISPRLKLGIMLGFDLGSKVDIPGGTGRIPVYRGCRQSVNLKITL